MCIYIEDEAFYCDWIATQLKVNIILFLILQTQNNWGL